MFLYFACENQLRTAKKQQNRDILNNSGLKFVAPVDDLDLYTTEIRQYILGLIFVFRCLNFWMVEVIVLIFSKEIQEK